LIETGNGSVSASSASKRELVFVDDKGGALASLAASMAAVRGAQARAATTAPLRPFPEVADVLAEIGVADVVAAEHGLTAGAGSERELVVLGEAAIQGASPTLALRLYEGPAQTAFGSAELERLALARIARDRIERWLDQR